MGTGISGANLHIVTAHPSLTDPEAYLHRIIFFNMDISHFREHIRFLCDIYVCKLSFFISIVGEWLRKNQLCLGLISGSAQESLLMGLRGPDIKLGSTAYKASTLPTLLSPSLCI